MLANFFLLQIKEKRALGLIHMRHFGTQYCDEKIKRYAIKKKKRFLLTNQGKLLKKHTLIFVLFTFWSKAYLGL